MRHAFCAAALLLAAHPSFPQQPAVPTQFEVASVKRLETGGPPGDIPMNMDPSPGHFAMRNVPLRYAIEWAYDLKDYQISGPEWIKADDRFEIAARAAGPATDEQMRPMLQTLLTERLQMKTHRETREMPVYVLVLGKGSPKLRQPAPDSKPHLASGAEGVTFVNFPLSRFTFLLTRRLDRPVLDLTGLKGSYDYTIDISGLPMPGNKNIDAPSIFSTVRSDLGLELKPSKEPVSILVIDQVSRIPAAN
jgi:uncharacterized protein (TIGR03435 family)